MKLIKTLLLITVIGLAGCASSSISEPMRELPKKSVEITIDLTPQSTLPAAPQPTATNTAVPLPTDTATAKPEPTATNPLPPTPTATTIPTKQATPKPTNTVAPVPTVVQPTQPPVVVAPPTFTPVPAVVEPTNPPAPVSGGYVCGDGSACIKGNINSDGERIYHFPGCGSYTRTQIDTSKGERWFTTSGEAEAAGWRRAQNCPK